MVDIRVHTTQRLQLIDITGDVARAVAQSSRSTGLCNLFATHTTVAVIVSENWDPDVTSDLLRHLERLVPLKSDFRHAEGNSQAHILSVMLGTSINIPVREGKLALGRWQGVMLAEFDGPRERTVVVSVARLDG
ncbi:MAG: secondary thiamine-phosphate synthase enzyme YjbQ [Candidatus Binataceae bacterium]